VIHRYIGNGYCELISATSNKTVLVPSSILLAIEDFIDSEVTALTEKVKERRDLDLEAEYGHGYDAGVDDTRIKHSVELATLKSKLESCAKEIQSTIEESCRPKPSAE
jgi:hypothetical protein